MAETAQEHVLAGDSAVFPTAGASPDGVSAESALSARDQQMLALERQWWKYAGAKEQAIRELFDLSATHYYQILNALIDTEGDSDGTAASDTSSAADREAGRERRPGPVPPTGGSLGQH